MIKLSIAPMLDVTDRHCRYFLRLLSKHTLLYTEMITANALIHGDNKKFLKFHSSEHPIALQLGGSNPKKLALCTKMATDMGFDEVNLNVGCPSARVQSGSFGLCLMHEPDLVAECVAAMQAVTKTPITVKTRTGVDKQDSYEFLSNFIATVAKTGCDEFIIHARKGWLNGLSPKANRNIPPLQYDKAYQLKANFPKLNIAINGGIKTLDESKQHLEHVDSVMIGRAAYNNPYFLAQADKEIFNDNHPISTREEIYEKMEEYIKKEVADGINPHKITRHLGGLYLGEIGAKAWRQKMATVQPTSSNQTNAESQ